MAGEILSHLPTTWTFGRESKPRSHFIYSCDQSFPSQKISDPTDRQCVVEYRCVNADGHRGSQTVFPPSINYNPKNDKSEHVQFEAGSTTELATVPASDLRKAFVLIGVVALLAKHFPADSERHNTILALSGVFARSGMSVTKATQTSASLISIPRDTTVTKVKPNPTWKPCSSRSAYRLKRTCTATPN